MSCPALDGWRNRNYPEHMTSEVELDASFGPVVEERDGAFPVTDEKIDPPFGFVVHGLPPARVPSRWESRPGPRRCSPYPYAANGQPGGVGSDRLTVARSADATPLLRA